MTMPKYEVGDIVVLKRLNNEPDDGKYDIFYYDGDLNFSWEGTGEHHRFMMDESQVRNTWGTIDDTGFMQDDISIREDIDTNFLIVDAKLHAPEFRMGFYILMSLTTNFKYKEDYFKIDALMDKRHA